MQRDGGPGGGAGGLGSGGSFTGPAEALEIYGDFAAAYSGQVTDAASGAADTTVLNFRTGNYIFVGAITWVTNYQGGNDTFINISLNGNGIYVATYDTDPHLVNDQPFDLVIPAYTEVSFKWGVTAVTRELCALLVGRIYRD